jgi:hypothetical protein
MIIKTSLSDWRVSEVPITLHPDGRVAHAPHLKTFRDGWRTLRFFLMCSPRWLFLVPGFLFVLLGLLGYAIVLPGIEVLGARPDAHTLLVASLSILIGYQSILFALFTKTFATSVGLLPEDQRLDHFFEIFDLEKGLVASIIALVVGVALVASAANEWRATGFGSMDYSTTMRTVIPGTTLTAIGFQTLLSSFFVSILGMRRK